MPLISKSVLRLHTLCAFLAIGSFVWGYDVGILSSVLVHPGFKATLGNPDASRTGLVTAIYYLGTWLSYVFLSQLLNDRLGRRYASAVGILVACVGTALQAGATGDPTRAFAMVIAGRIIAGLGIAVVSTGVPMYQSEVAPAKDRGRYVVMNHVGFVFGLAMGFWAGYGVTFWTDENDEEVAVGWRFSLSLAFIPAVIFMAGIPFLKETPRWLVEHGQNHRALHSLAYFREGSFSADEIDFEYNQIEREVADYRASGMNWTSLFTKRSLFSRLWRAALLQFMAQMCGATAMKYYLPTLFKALGLGTQLALLAGGIESTLKIFCTIFEMLVIDTVGRRLTISVGAGVMAFGMLINGVLPLVYPRNINRASDYTCIVFIFIYSLGYSLSFGPASWVYGSEIFPNRLRARGLNLAASGGAIGSIVVAQVWPVGIATIGSRIYFFFMAINLICVPIVYLLYPETKGRRLEEMDGLFSGGLFASNRILTAEAVHDDIGEGDVRDEVLEDDVDVASGRSRGKGVDP